jgi:protein involved in polysaccharide export with SLBB domain
MIKKSTHLADVIEMAGGITDHAYLRGATLLRRMNEEERVRMQATMKIVRDILSERGDSVSYDKLDIENNYPVVIDLEKAIKDPTSDANILMREGDQIFIPEYNPIVRISGDVMFPNTVFYENGKNWKYYVNQAGGMGDRARKKKSFIVYQNGKAKLINQGAQPEPGCEIVIASKKRKRPWRVAEVVGAVTGLTGLASMITAIAYMTKR